MTASLVDVQLVRDGEAVTFTNAGALTMPFPGSVIVPRPAGQPLAWADIPAEHRVHAHLINPEAASTGLRFPSLRDLTGAVVTVHGPVLLLVAQDPIDTLEDPHPIPASPAGSSTPRTLLLRFTQPTDLGTPTPASLAAARPVRQAVPLATDRLDGEVRAFDFAGMQIPADAALQALGIQVPDSPTGVRVQLVDLWGRPLGPDDLPASALQFAPALQPGESPAFVATAPLGQAGPLRITAAAPASGTVIEQYRANHLRIGVWPGHDTDLKRPEVQVSLAGGGFLRLCVVDPTSLMQTDVGGAVDVEGAFISAGETIGNGLRVCCEDNAVTMLNDGRAFMADLHHAVAAAGAGSALYLANWRADAHLHLLGSTSLYQIPPSDTDPGTVQQALTAVLAQGKLFTIHPDAEPEHPEQAPSRFLLLAQPPDADLLCSPRIDHSRPQHPAWPEDEPLPRGFLRAHQPCAIILPGVGSSPLPCEITASWKDSAGGTHVVGPITANTWPPPDNKPHLPAGALRLGITEADPPRATLRRATTYQALTATLGQPAEAVLSVLVLNTTAGTWTVLPLDTESAAQVAELGEICGDQAPTTATDTLIAAVVDGRPAGFPDPAALRSTFTPLTYPDAEHRGGQIPLADEELGGLLRGAVAKGVTVRALLWEQAIAQLSGEDPSGHATNWEIASIINAERAGKRGFAAIDRSTRVFGAFHQKAAVLITPGPGPSPPTATAWVGGLDLALGRWDTEEHHSVDPDRQGGRWWDTHARITGDGAVDVLRNFKHRWEALGCFLDQQLQAATHLNQDDPVLADALRRTISLPDACLPPELPDALVQITRTFAPRSPHAAIGNSLRRFLNEAGELGTRAALMKTIAASRRFIVIADQYFFSSEVALALHQALARADGPQFLILLLPRDLSEFGPADPLLYLARRKALEILWHGSSGTCPDPGPCCGTIVPNPAVGGGVADKVAVLYARNRAGDPVYVHAKHTIVDDVWMTVGSSNLNYRGMTFDCELNASIVGTSLYRGGTEVVRNQRVEVFRRMLGLPPAYSSLLQDPHAMFAVARELQSRGTQPGNPLHPQPPMAQRLDPDYHGSAEEEEEVFVGLESQWPVLSKVFCMVVDPDGRSPTDPLAPLMNGLGYGHFGIGAYGSVSIEVDSRNAVDALHAGQTLHADVQLSQDYLDESEHPHQTPWSRVYLATMSLDGAGRVTVAHSGDITIPLSTSRTTHLLVQAMTAEASIPCQARIDIDPDAPPILPGTLHPITVTMRDT